MNKKKLIISLSIIGIVAAIAIGGTIAYFSDIESSVGNKFVAGKFNLKIDNTCHYNGKVCSYYDSNNGFTPGYYWNGDPTQEPCFCTWEEKDLDGELYFNLLDVKPGDFGEDTISLHVDNNDAWVCAEIANLVSDDNGCEKPESDIDETCGAGEGELQDNLFFTIWRDNGIGIDHACNNIKDDDENYVIQNQTATAGIWPIADSTNGTPLEGDKTYCLGVNWNVPLATGNEIQTDSLMVDVIFTAVQSRNMDTFKCSDLTDNGGVGGDECVPTTEVCDGIDNDCDQQIDEGNPGGGGSCDTGLQGICSAGTLTCTTGVLSCVQDVSASIEVCSNGLDDDCDGSVDEGCTLAFMFSCTSNADCNDGNPCTNDVCTAGSCGYSNNTGSCNDGDGCTSLDFCSNGSCTGIPITAFGTNTCVIETCTAAAGYSATHNINGVSCWDFGCIGTNCVGYGCLNGVCTAAQLSTCTSDLQCNDSNLCTTDSCNLTSGKCTHSLINCDDGNASTIDMCNLASGCTHSACVNYYYDYDGDGYGTSAMSCILPTPGNLYRATQSGDCNDGNGLVNPGALEICGNFIDDNCNGQIDEGTCTTIPVSPFTPSGGCTTDLQCDDGNDLTIDGCANGTCASYPAISVPSISFHVCWLGGCFCWPHSDLTCF